MSHRWRAPAFSELSFRDYEDGETVVFDAGSGSTHVVDPLAGAILRALAGRAMAWNELLAILAREGGVDDAPTLEAYLDSLLHSLQRQHLVEPAAE